MKTHAFNFETLKVRLEKITISFRFNRVKGKAWNSSKKYFWLEDILIIFITIKKKDMQQIKIFSGSQISSMAVIQILEERGIEYLVKNQFESARLAGFGNLDAAVEIFIKETDLDRVGDLKLR